VLITSGPSNEFPWISIWLLVKPHADCCVVNTQSTLAASCVCWIVPIVTCESRERTCGCSCLKWTWSNVKVVLQIELCVGSGVQKSGDALDDCLFVRPPTKVQCWAVAYGVIVTGYTLFVTSQYGVIITPVKQRFSEVETTCILLYTHSPYSFCTICHCNGHKYQRSTLGDRSRTLKQRSS